MRTVVVLAADLEEHRPRGRARDRVHEPLAASGQLEEVMYGKYF